MQRSDSPLDNIKIASPCSADWNEMRGTQRKRFCGDCKLNVYNLSGMARYDAENLLRLSEGRLCVRYYQRSDGTVLTADCPVGWAKVKQRLSVAAAAAFSMFIAVLGLIGMVPLMRKNVESVRRVVIPFAPSVREYEVMGAIAMPSPTPTPKREQVRRSAERPVVPARRFAE